MSDNLSLGDMNTFAGDGINKTNGQLLFKGDEIGGYKVIKQLGAGGMGQVYLVENIQMHKKYAMKVLPPKLSRSCHFIDRFRVEGRIMSDLKHNNIVSVHVSGEDKKTGLFYLIMDYIPGSNGSPNTLEDCLKRDGKLSEDLVLKITKQLCSALDYAHNFRGRGIVHRDLKPSNILLDAKENAHLVDFGLAKVVGSDYLQSMIDRSIRLTKAGMGISKNPSIGDMKTVNNGRNVNTDSTDNADASIACSLIGTYEFMSPEQQEGKDATIQSDIYSLGLIIYRILTGEKTRGRWKLPSELGFEEKWDSIILKCLEQNPEDRFNSSLELLEILDCNVNSFDRIPIQEKTFKDITMLVPQT